MRLPSVNRASMGARRTIDVLVDAKAMNRLGSLPRLGFTQVCVDLFGESRVPRGLFWIAR
jgi:hypothetical protein